MFMCKIDMKLSLNLRLCKINNYNTQHNNQVRNYMDRDIKIFNRPVMNKIQQKNQELHRKRLQNIKSGISNRSTIHHRQTISRKKGFMIEEEKKTQIEKHNAILFNKMIRIMKRPDPHNKPRNKTFMNSKQKGSFDASRIMEENKSFLSRLQQQKPTISNKKLYEERMKNINILKFLGKYPNPSYRKNSLILDYSTSNKKMNTIEDGKKGSQFGDENYEDAPTMYKEMSGKKKREVASSSGRRKYLTQTLEQKTRFQKMVSENSEFSQQMNHQKITLFKERKFLHEYPGTIEILRTYNQYEISVAFDDLFQGKSNYLMGIPENEGKDFFEAYNYDYGRISEMLIIEDGNLVIDVNKALGKRKNMKQNEIQKTMPANIAEWNNAYEQVDQLVQ